MSNIETFSITNQALIDAFLIECSHGTLAVSADDIPYCVNVFFLYLDGYIYFHSNPKARKVAMIRKNPNVSFNIKKEYSQLSSYFFHPEIGCYGGKLYKSVTIDGKAEFVDVIDDRIRIFTELMKKLQPEGGHSEFTEKIRWVAKEFTSVIRISPDNIAAKWKMGQNYNDESFKKLIDNLKSRNTLIDNETVEEMQKLRPLLLREL